MIKRTKEHWQTEKNNFSAFMEKINRRTIAGELTLHERSFIIYSVTNGMTPEKYIASLEEKTAYAPHSWNTSNPVIAFALVVMLLFSIIYFITPDSGLTGFMTYEPTSEISDSSDNTGKFEGTYISVITTPPSELIDDKKSDTYQTDDNSTDGKNLANNRNDHDIGR